MHTIRFSLGFRLRPRWGSLQRSPDLLAVFQGDHKWRAGKEGKDKKGEGKGREREEEGK